MRQTKRLIVPLFTLAALAVACGDEGGPSESSITSGSGGAGTGGTETGGTGGTKTDGSGGTEMGGTGGDGGATGGDGGAGETGTGGSSGTETIQPALRSAIVQQIVPVDLDDGLYVELVTIANFPYQLNVDSLDIPSGLSLVDFSEDVTGRQNCEAGGACKQRFDIWLEPDTACTLNGDYTASFTYSCMDGGDCELLDPAVTDVDVDFSLTSENFCTGLEPEAAGTLVTTTAGAPASGEFVTLVNYPYLLVPEQMVIPNVNVTITENVAGRQNCAIGLRCKQRFDITWSSGDGGTTCGIDGIYDIDFSYVCASGADCSQIDPLLTETLQMSIYGLDICSD